MNHTLAIHTKNAPAVMERLLQVTRFRGFELKHLEMHSDHSNGLDICVTVGGEKSISLLTNQLEKLYEVESIVSEQINELALVK